MLLKNPKTITANRTLRLSQSIIVKTHCFRVNERRTFAPCTQKTTRVLHTERLHRFGLGMGKGLSLVHWGVWYTTYARHRIARCFVDFKRGGVGWGGWFWADRSGRIRHRKLVRNRPQHDVLFSHPQRSLFFVCVFGDPTSPKTKRAKRAGQRIPKRTRFWYTSHDGAKTTTEM